MSQQIEMKERIKTHYELCSPYYLDLWGEHIHHGYWVKGDETKEKAQEQLILLLASHADLKPNQKILDVGCGLGGTSMYLAELLQVEVVGITLSPIQAKMASQIAQQKKISSVKFLEMDAETIAQNFPPQTYDRIWVSEALSHFPSKPKFFQQASTVLKSDGRLIIADWFKAENLTKKQEADYIKPIETGMLLPQLCTTKEYIQYANNAGLKLRFSQDISENVSKTWDICFRLIQNVALWKLAGTMGWDFINFLRAFQAMRSGYSSKTFIYAILIFQKDLPSKL